MTSAFHVQGASAFLRFGRIFMLTSLSLIFLVGLALAAICEKIRLPRIVGMIVTGILLGPYVLDLLDPHPTSFHTIPFWSQRPFCCADYKRDR